MLVQHFPTVSASSHQITEMIKSHV